MRDPRISCLSSLHPVLAHHATVQSYVAQVRRMLSVAWVQVLLWLPSTLGKQGFAGPCDVFVLSQPGNKL